MDGPLDGDDTCFDLSTSLQMGSYLLVVASVLLLLVGYTVLKVLRTYVDSGSSSSSSSERSGSTTSGSSSSSSSSSSSGTATPPVVYIMVSSPRAPLLQAGVEDGQEIGACSSTTCHIGS